MMTHGSWMTFNPKMPFSSDWMWPRRPSEMRSLSWAGHMAQDIGELPTGGCGDGVLVPNHLQQPFPSASAGMLCPPGFPGAEGAGLAELVGQLGIRLLLNPRSQK